MIRRSAAAFLFAAFIRCSVINAQPAGPDSSPTWAREVAPILYRHCVDCHAPGRVAPFSLLSYTDAAKRPRALARAVRARRMPPWLPANPTGTFAHERGLSESEIAVIESWAHAGAPAGEIADAPAPPASAGEEWQLGPPDLIVRMRQPVELPAGPGDVYKAFTIPVDWSALPPEILTHARIPDSDWLAVSAVEVHAGNRRVLHHAHVFADNTGTARRLEAEAGGNGYEAFGNPGFAPAGYLGGHVPGMTPQRLPPGIAESLPLGSDIVLQIHYASTGKPETDQTEVGIYFVREPVKRLVEWLRLGSFNLEIPAGAAAHTIEDELEIPADCFVLSISPHMHLLGREVTAHATLPDGKRLDLISVPRWDFAWQDRYSYRKPLYLPRGTVVRARWVYDNTDDNPNNPHAPARAIHFGPNTTDEMCELHLFVVPVELADYSRFSALMQRKLAEKIAELTPEQRRRYGFEQ